MTAADRRNNNPLLAKSRVEQERAHEPETSEELCRISLMHQLPTEFKKVL